MLRPSYIILSILLLVLQIWGQDEIPEKPTSWVNDYTQVLSASEKKTLDDMLSGLEQRSSNQIFIAIFKQMPDKRRTRFSRGKARDGNYMERN